MMSIVKLVFKQIDMGREDMNGAFPLHGVFEISTQRDKVAVGVGELLTVLTTAQLTQLINRAQRKLEETK